MGSEWSEDHTGLKEEGSWVYPPEDPRPIEVPRPHCLVNHGTGTYGKCTVTLDNLSE